MGKGQITGAAFLQGVLSKIADPGLRAQAEAVFANAAVQTEIGNGVEGQSEIDRRLQELTTKTADLATKTTEIDQREARITTWHDELAGWKTSVEDLVQIGSAAKKIGWKPGDPAPKVGDGPVKLPDNIVTAEQHTAALQRAGQEFLGFHAESNQLMREHFAKFGEILDVTQLMKHPDVGKVGLIETYRTVHKDALTAKDTEAAAKREETIRADERQKVLAQTANQLPYPLTSGPGSGSPLDGIKPLVPAAIAPKDVVGDAVAEYTRLQQSRV